MNLLSQTFRLIASTVVSTVAVFSVGEVYDAKTPFGVGTSVAVPDTMFADPLNVFELRGIVRFENETRVCFVDTQTKKATWVKVGEARKGLVAEEYDSVQASVLVRSGNVTRWFKLREDHVVPIPIATLADGSVDTFHMSLTEKEKAEVARDMVGDILQIARLGREGRLNTGKASQSPLISQPR